MFHSHTIACKHVGSWWNPKIFKDDVQVQLITKCNKSYISICKIEHYCNQTIMSVYMRYKQWDPWFLPLRTYGINNRKLFADIEIRYRYIWIRILLDGNESHQNLMHKFIDSWTRNRKRWKYKVLDFFSEKCRSLKIIKFLCFTYLIIDNSTITWVLI